jgi:hypothetical protein
MASCLHMWHLPSACALPWCQLSSSPTRCRTNRATWSGLSVSKDMIFRLGCSSEYLPNMLEALGWVPEMEIKIKKTWFAWYLGSGSRITFWSGVWRKALVKRRGRICGGINWETGKLLSKWAQSEILSVKLLNVYTVILTCFFDT